MDWITFDKFPTIGDAWFKVKAYCNRKRPIRVHIKYCGTCLQYIPHYNEVANVICTNFKPEDVYVTGEMTPLIPDNFEIWVVGETTNKLLHSKRNGEGWVDTDEKRQKIIDGIKRALGELV